MGGEGVDEDDQYILYCVDCKNNTFLALRYYDETMDTVFSKYYINGTTSHAS